MPATRPGSHLAERTALRRRFLMCPPGALRRRLRDQPVDGPRTARRHRPGPCAVGVAAGAYLSLGHEVALIDPVDRGCPTWCSRRTARPWWTAGRRARCARAAAGGGASYAAWFRTTGSPRCWSRCTSTRARATSSSWTTCPGRDRLPHGARRPPGGQEFLRASRGRPASSSTRALPPGHRALPAGRGRGHLLPGGVLARKPGGAGAAVPRRGPRGRGGRGGPRAERGLRRAPRRASTRRRPADRGAARPRFRRPSRWTCRNSARRAAAPSAAPWNCAPDSSRRRRNR